MQPLKRKRRWRTGLVLIGMLLTAYPAFVLTYTWSHVLQSPLPGGRHGPLDAYRHTLASAVVAYTLDARAVGLVNGVMERRGRRSNAMDIHNNLIGARIGARAMRFSDIEPMVARSVASGSIDGPDDVAAAERLEGRIRVVTLAPPGKWRQRRRPHACPMTRTGSAIVAPATAGPTPTGNPSHPCRRLS
ncbi:hypothetical protein [Pseudoxanthomonas sp. SE1]|uniref:hypothetical protein n=1 Tax=Pseudoxanthomonas sp. SE1 TaxID=1664560 RepID=UPI00240D878C|nr:hypothetical protein [Pseudoxanthomonas sp. SE1]WFC43144.1 hypothetical protein OY559_06425 [Pseudoxanthomonas sp. SE1]